MPGGFSFFLAVATPMKRDYPVQLMVFGVLIFFVSALGMVLAKRAPDRYDSAPEVWNLTKNIGEVSSGFCEVSRMLDENNDNMKSVSRHIAEVDQTADDVRDNTTLVDKSAESLLNLASNLGRLVESAAS